MLKVSIGAVTGKQGKVDHQRYIVKLNCTI